MRKYYKLTILILCLLISSFAIPNIVKADTFNSNTLIYTQYNDKADYYDNLTGISTFAIKDDYIAYTLNNTDIIILNKATNQISQLFYGNSEFDTISDIWLTKNFLFVNDISGIRAYSLSDFTPASIVIDSQSALLSKYKDYSVAEDNDRIAIACINDKEFITYFYSPNDLKLISKYTNSALNYDECDLLNIATTTNKAFIITNSTDPDNTLWKINYSNNSVYSNALFPKSNITSFVVYTYTENQSTTDYLIATDNTTAIFVIRTDLLQKNIVDEDEGHDLTDQTRTGNPVKPNFTVKDISNPEYITVYILLGL